jgi:hypothetical protein
MSRRDIKQSQYCCLKRVNSPATGSYLGNLVFDKSGNPVNLLWGGVTSEIKLLTENGNLDALFH